jgi:flagellar biogenesis protein FliO
MSDRDEHSASLKTLSVTVAAGIAVGIALIVLVIWLLRHMG